MFELRPYRRHNNEIAYNPFREMEEFERRFFGELCAVFLGEIHHIGRNGFFAEILAEIVVVDLRRGRQLRPRGGPARL